MLPVFPEFKQIELADKEFVEKKLAGFLPYSDFNFVSLWSWNFEGKMELSILNDNLVVKFADYRTGEPFYSFIGSNLLNETTTTLLHHNSQGNQSSIRLLPEEIALQLDPTQFSVTEDRDNFDYIYSLEELDELPGSKFAKKRNHVSAFLRDFPHASAGKLNLSDDGVSREIKSLFSRLNELRTEKGIGENSHELAVLERLLQHHEALDIQAVGISIDKQIVAVMIEELLPNEYSIGHLMAADNAVSGSLYTFLIKKNAEITRMNNARFFNFEQDLGIENLRIAKSRFRPLQFLKKYTVAYSPT